MTEKDLEERRKNLKLSPDDFYIVEAEAIHEVQVELGKMLDHRPDEEAAIKIHASIDALQKQHHFNEALQCSKQECSYCCHSEIFIGKPEANLIKKYGKYEIDKQRQAKQRAATNYNQLSFADKACIMLKDGKCQVYELRPSLCRNHGISVGESPHDCFRQSRDLGIPGTEPVKIQQPRMIPLEAMATYITIKGAKGIQDVKNIAEYDW